MRVIRWKLALLLVMVFTVCVTSPWSLQAWAQWQGQSTFTDTMASSDSESDRAHKLASLRNLSLPAGPQQLQTALDETTQQNERPQEVRWTIRGGSWDAVFSVRGPFRDWRAAIFPRDAQRESVRQQKIPQLTEQGQMVVATAFERDGQKLRSFVAMYRDSGELMSPRTQLTTQDVVERFQRPPANETSRLWQVELRVRQSSSVDVADGYTQQADAFGQLLQSVLNHWNRRPVGDEEERSP